MEGTQPLTAQEQDLLARGLGLARRLGGEVVHATGDDVAATLLEVARERNVSVHGLDIVDGLDDFYATVARLFETGVIAGLKILAR